MDLERGHSWVKGLCLSHRPRDDNDGDNGTGIYGEYHGVAFGVGKKKVRGAASVRDSHIRVCVCVRMYLSVGIYQIQSVIRALLLFSLDVILVSCIHLEMQNPS